MIACMPTPPLKTRLDTLDRDQLAALVERLVTRHPDLIDLVHIPLPGEKAPADPISVGAHVTRILMMMGNDWQASWRAQFNLFPIAAMGDDYRTQGLIEDARTVYRAIIDAILPMYEQIRDEESEIADVVGNCVEALGACLDATDDRELRNQILMDVFHVYRWDTVGNGGYGMDAPASKVLLANTTEAEKDAVASWLRDALSKASAHEDRYGHRQAGELILRLEGDRLNPATREDTYAQAGMHRERLELLLASGRNGEAIEVLRHANRDLISLAERLVAAGLGDMADDVMDQHPAVLDSNAGDLRKWLVKRGRIEPNALDQLVRALDHFTYSPLVGTWHRLHAEAEKSGRWQQLLPRALAAVNNELSNAQPARARILAMAGRFAEAETVLARLAEGAWKSAALDVAAAAESTRPDLARVLYTRIGNNLRARGTKPARIELAEITKRLASLSDAGDRGTEVTALHPTSRP